MDESRPPELTYDNLREKNLRAAITVRVFGVPVSERANMSPSFGAASGWTAWSIVNPVNVFGISRRSTSWRPAKPTGSMSMADESNGTICGRIRLPWKRAIPRSR